jgi:site-specific DNA recombinase
MDEQRSTIRCAIYTRKSTEEGLEQEFNSLDAQREAAEAYILSQRLAGWVTTPGLYDDGGFSGASMDRPALRQLLADVEAGKVDCVVVYKVDRLSRSLLDFSRLIELFDRFGVSFVSVTQEFNSTTSLGRLTLNILLSFAQFEREIIGERTRDKIAAARRKGKWMGGSPVLGYDADPQARRLVVNEDEAARVRRIFEIAAKADSLNTTLAGVEAEQLMAKEYTSKTGRYHAARRFNRITLRRLLSNVMYTGLVSYKGIRYPGEHPPIIDKQAWEIVNEQLGLRSAHQRRRSHRKQDALLCQLLYCGECAASMMPTYAVKGGQRYRYYVCTAARRSRRQGCAQRQVAAAELEPSVIRHLEPILGTQLSAPIIQQAIERITYEAITRRVTIGLRAGTQTEYSLPEPIRRGARGRTPGETGRVPRISRVMGLAIRMERLVREGSVTSYRDLAEVGQISVPRLSQILRLLDLASGAAAIPAANNERSRRGDGKGPARAGAGN